MTRDQQRFWKATGMLAVLFYVLHVVVGGFLWKGYDHLQQPISDLTATGAPHRGLMLLFTNLYSLFAVCFSLAFLISERGKHAKPVFWGALLFALMQLVSLSYGFFPEDLPGQEPTFTGSMHLVVTALIVPLTILAPFFIGFGFLKEPDWKRFGRWSIFTGLLILVFGGATAYLFVHKLPYFGLTERMNIGILQAWVFGFSYKWFRS